MIYLQNVMQHVSVCLIKSAEQITSVCSCRKMDIPLIKLSLTGVKTKMLLKKDLKDIGYIISYESDNRGKMAFLGEYHLIGLVVGLSTFLIIGLFHPIVIKFEYHFGVACWWIFLVLGIITLVLSFLSENIIISSLLGVFSFSSFWSILEIFQQQKRVKKGWFPSNPKRNK